MTRKTSFLLVSVIFYAATTAMADPAASVIKIYPLNAVFFDQADKGAGSLLDPEFKEGFDRKKAAEGFVAEFTSQFPQAVKTIAREDRYRTFVASAQVLRASHYELKKPNGRVDIYLPVTVSFYLTNPLTGEVFYRATGTEYSIIPTEGGQSTKVERVEQYQNAFQSLVKKAITEFKSKFNPIGVETKVVKSWKVYYILDKGSLAGLQKGDTVSDSTGNLLSIVYSGDHYSVAKMFLGKASTDQVFWRYSNQSTSDIKKPKLFVFFSGGDGMFSEPVASQLLSDSLGQKAAFTIVPVNRNFTEIQKAYIQSSSLSQTIQGQRETPDYFLRLALRPALFITKLTNKDYIQKKEFHSAAHAEIMDGTGRVVYSALVREIINDDVVHSVDFDPAARKEVLYKNAIIQLAQNISEGVTISKMRFEVVEKDNDLLKLKDVAALLSIGTSHTLYRNVGDVSGISEDKVLVPIALVKVVARVGESVKLQRLIAIEKDMPSPDTGDVLLLDSFSAKGGTAGSLHSCGKADVEGPVKFPFIDESAAHLLSTSGKHSIYRDKDLADVVRLRLNRSTGFKDNVRIIAPIISECYEPVAKAKATESDCGNAGQTCTDGYALVSALRIKNGAAVRDEVGFENQLKVGLFKPTRADAVELELGDEWEELLSKGLVELGSTESKQQGE